MPPADPPSPSEPELRDLLTSLLVMLAVAPQGDLAELRRMLAQAAAPRRPPGPQGST